MKKLLLTFCSIFLIANSSLSEKNKGYTDYKWVGTVTIDVVDNKPIVKYSVKKFPQKLFDMSCQFMTFEEEGEEFYRCEFQNEIDGHKIYGYGGIYVDVFVNDNGIAKVRLTILKGCVINYDNFIKIDSNHFECGHWDKIFETQIPEYAPVPPSIPRPELE